MIPARWRLYLIIAGSTIFYAWWKIEYVWIPYLLMAIAYFGALWMMRAKQQHGRKIRLIVTIVLVNRNAQTIGKKIMGIKVARTDGSRNAAIAICLSSSRSLKSSAMYMSTQTMPNLRRSTPKPDSSDHTIQENLQKFRRPARRG